MALLVETIFSVSLSTIRVVCVNKIVAIIVLTE